MPVPPWERPARLVIGRILKPHGIDGTMRMDLYTHFPERIPGLEHVYLGDEETPRQIEQARVLTRHALLKVASLTSLEEAEAFAGSLVRIDHEQTAPLPPGEYYHWQIIGATVVTDTGETLGRVAEILETGANDVYIVRAPEGNEILLPAIGEVIQAVDTERGIITVHLLPGLVEPPPPPPGE